MSTMNPLIHAFFDPDTHTVSYLVADPVSREAAVIDPVLDFDMRSGQVATRSADRLLDAAHAQGLHIRWVLETHAHADHLSAAPHIRQQTGAPIAMGERITEVQAIFGPRFNLGLAHDGREFDRLLQDGEHLPLGELHIAVMATPGHTPACVSYRIGDAVFVGDTLFMPDYGTARADFPGGDAATLYRSIRQLLALPPSTRLFMCHDYLPEGRSEFAWESTVAAQRAHNVHVHDGVSEAQFVALREQRDAGLAAPQLLLPAIQVNICAGQLPAPEANGVVYLKLPLQRAEA